MQSVTVVNANIVPVLAIFVAYSQLCTVAKLQIPVPEYTYRNQLVVYIKILLLFVYIKDIV